MNWTQWFKNLGVISFLAAGVAALIKQYVEFLFEKKSIKYQVQYSELYQQRAKVIKNLYEKIEKTHHAYLKMASIPKGEKPPYKEFRKTRQEEAVKIKREMKSYYKRKKIFLRAEEIKKIEKLFEQLRHTLELEQEIAFAEENGMADQGADDSDLEDYFDLLTRTADVVSQEIPEIKEELEKNFKEAIGLE